MNIESIQEFIELVGEPAILRRLSGPEQIPFDVELSAWSVGYLPTEIVGPITQGDQKVSIGVREIEEAQWPAPPRKGDVIVIGGKDAAILGCDAVNFGSTVCRYNLQVRGTQ